MEGSDKESDSDIVDTMAAVRVQVVVPEMQHLLGPGSVDCSMGERKDSRVRT